MNFNLLSAIILYDREYEISINFKKKIEISKDEAIVVNIVRKEKLFKLRILSEFQTRNTIIVESIRLWHHRLWHLKEENVRKLKTMTDEIKLNKDINIDVRYWALPRLGSRVEGSRW